MRSRRSNIITLFLCLILLGFGTTSCDNSSDTDNSEPTLVEVNGLLSVNGNQIVNKDGDSIAFAGNSFFWSNDGWGGEFFYNTRVLDYLIEEWNTTIVRVALGVENSGGYLEEPESNIAKIETIIDAAIDRGIYVIIDWHSHHAEDYQQEAIEFFDYISKKYGQYDHVLYEIYNEPLQVSWTNVVKPYAEEIIRTIRRNDPDNMIIVGSPNWSQKVDLVAADPITIDDNIAYTLHFYSVHHQQWLRDRAIAAMAQGIPLFVTEWGPIGYTQDDPESMRWIEWCRQYNISHLAWAVNDKEEEWSIFKNGTNPAGPFTDSNLTESGLFEKDIISNWVTN